MGLATALMASGNGSTKAAKEKRLMKGYFPVPSGFIGGGIAAKIGPTAVAIYMALCEHRNREAFNSYEREGLTLEFRISDRTLATDTGISARTVFDARKKLVDAGLIEIQRTNTGRCYDYKLLPVEVEWLPVRKRARIKKRRRDSWE